MLFSPDSELLHLPLDPCRQSRDMLISYGADRACTKLIVEIFLFSQFSYNYAAAIISEKCKKYPAPYKSSQLSEIRPSPLSIVKCKINVKQFVGPEVKQKQ